MATAYTIRYGKAKAGIGPGLDASRSVGLGDDKGLDGSLVIEFECTRGGGSMNVDEVVGTIGSGRAGISPAPEVSMVMF